MDCLVGVFMGMEIDAKPCPCSNFSLVHVGQHHRDNPNERLEMDAGAGHSDYPSELIFTSDKFVVTAFGYDREHCEDVLQCVLHGRFGDHEGDREWRKV
ncbi:MAG: hypothetical protein IPL32_20185 [Chloracidobacterium sp.]|nr:hypothetical protein [Chloracidobacterium sp.]